MQGVNASFVLMKNELYQLFSSFADLKLSFPAQFILNEYLSGSGITEDAVEGLVAKKLARKEAGELIIEPVIGLLVKSLLTTDKLWIIKCIDTIEPALVTRAQDLYLYIKDYSLAACTWKITPFRNAAGIVNELRNITISEIVAVTVHGERSCVKPDDNFCWLREDDNGKVIC